MPKFRTKSTEVEAFEVKGGGGIADVAVGDWLVQDGSGVITAWPKDDFMARFERVEPARRGRPPKATAVEGPAKKRRRKAKAA